MKLIWNSWSAQFLGCKKSLAQKEELRVRVANPFTDDNFLHRGHFPLYLRFSCVCREYV